MLHAISLKGDTAEILETPISQTFGITDMYRDFANASNQHGLEEQFSRLESQVAKIIAKIRSENEQGKEDIWISRGDRDTLRKYMFIMKYRGSTAHRRFYHEDADDYDALDRQSLLSYMKEKGFSKPLDVWFNNIKALLELKMDPEKKWITELPKNMYDRDAFWAIQHMQTNYLSFCVPSNIEDEFLLTENAHSIHEGPSLGIQYTEYHSFAAISPRLIMVLRSMLLPDTLEDKDEGIRIWRQELQKNTGREYGTESFPKSIFHNLPICKARNSYSIVEDGKLKLKEGEDGKHRADHKFCFRFFPIGTEFVEKINAILLEESFLGNTLVFKSREAVKKSLEFFLTLPAGPSNLGNFKTVLNTVDCRRWICLKKLEESARLLGSDVKAIYHNSLPEQLLYCGEMEETLQLKSIELLKLYKILGTFLFNPFIIKRLKPLLTHALFWG